MIIWTPTMHKMLLNDTKNANKKSGELSKLHRIKIIETKLGL